MTPSCPPPSCAELGDNLPFNHEIGPTPSGRLRSCDLVAWLRAVRETRGRRVTQADVLIAATAHAHGLAVVTRNERNFEGCGVDILNPFS